VLLEAFIKGCNNNCMVNSSLLVTGLWIKFTDDTVGTIARSKVRGSDHPDWTGLQFIKQPEYSNAKIRDILLLIENNFQLFLLRLLPSIRVKEQPTAKSQCILKEPLSELRCT